jgi:hypothetical protein
MPSPATLEQEGRLSEWEMFYRAWPWGDGEAVEPIKQHFARLKAELRAAVLATVDPYLEAAAVAGESPMSARAFVVDRGWTFWRSGARARCS